MWNRVNTLTWRYITALLIIGFLALGSYAILQSTISRQEQDAALINVSGRQRMLSQRITLLSLELVTAGFLGEAKQPIQDSLTAAIDLFESSHNALVLGGPAEPLDPSGRPVTLPGVRTDLETEFYNGSSNSDEAIRTFISHARSLAEAPNFEQTSTNPDLIFILQIGPNEILQTLDDAVTIYQIQNETTVSLLQNLQTLVLVGTLSALALVGYFLFRPMVGEIAQNTQRLESSNERLTQQNNLIQTQSALLATAAGVSNQIVRIRDLEKLLHSAVHLIQDQFELYYVQVFLADAAGRSLAFQAGTGSVGEIFHNQAHRLPIGPGTISGTAAHRKETILVPNVPESQLYPVSPQLTDTKSSLAVPLIINERVVGVLNMQSDEYGQLTDQLRISIETLGSQLAIAIENASLFLQLQQAQEGILNQASRQSENGWVDFLGTIDDRRKLRYTYSLEGAVPETGTADHSIVRKLYSTPITIANVHVGDIQVEQDAEQSWSDEESELVQAVAERVGQRIENLRLLNDAQRFRAEAELALTKLTQESWKGFADEEMGPVSFLTDGVQLRSATNQSYTADHAVPLHIQGAKIGQIAVSKPQVRDEVVEEYTNVVAEVLGNHVDNLRLQQQTEHRVAELALLNQISSVTSRAFEVNTLAERIGELVKESFFVSSTYVALYDQDKDEVRFPYYAINLEGDEFHRVTVAPTPLNASSITGQIIRSMKSILINENIVERMRELGARSIGEDNSVHSFIGIPIMSAGQAVGVISIQNEHGRRTLNENDVTLLETIGGNIGITIENARLFSQMQKALSASQRQARELSAINQVVSAGASQTEFSSSMRVVAEELLAVTKASQVGIALIQDSGPDLEIVAAAGGDHESIKSALGAIIPVEGNPSTEAVFRTRQTQIYHDAQNNEMLAPAWELMRLRGVETIVIAPIMTSERVIGTVGLDFMDPDVQFSEQEITLIETITFQAATVIENRRLFAQLQKTLRQTEERARRERLVNEITEKIQTTVTVESALATTIEELGRALRARRSYIKLKTDPKGNGHTNGNHTTAELPSE